MPPPPQERASPAAGDTINTVASNHDQLSSFPPALASGPQRNGAPTEDQLEALIELYRPNDQVFSNYRADEPRKTAAPISNTAIGPFQPSSGPSRPPQRTDAPPSKKSGSAAPRNGTTFSQTGLGQAGAQYGMGVGLESAQYGASFMNQYNYSGVFPNPWNPFSFYPWAGVPCYTGSWTNWQQTYDSGSAYPESVLAPQPATVREDCSRFPQPVHKLPRSNSSSERLLDLDTDTLTAEEALFYFGVLSTLESLAPRFEYSSSFGGTQVVKLSFRGDTVCKEQKYDTKLEAKADACRKALHILKLKFGNWSLPPLPRDGIGLAGTWDWRTVLQGKNCPCFLSQDRLQQKRLLSDVLTFQHTVFNGKFQDQSTQSTRLKIAFELPSQLMGLSILVWNDCTRHLFLPLMLLLTTLSTAYFSTFAMTKCLVLACAWLETFRLDRLRLELKRLRVPALPGI
jgi:hypothetical protein